MENDWADEIVEKCRWMQGSIGALEMARQLRKAKADGMRECADWVQQIYGPDLANSFRETASKLSPT